MFSVRKNAKRYERAQKKTQSDKKAQTVIELINVEMYDTKVFQSHCPCMSPFCTIIKGDMAPFVRIIMGFGKNKTVKLF